MPLNTMPPRTARIQKMRTTMPRCVPYAYIAQRPARSPALLRMALSAFPHSCSASADALQLWGNALSAILKSAGLLAGLWAMYAYGTQRGIVVRIFWILAVLGGIVFSGIWVYIAATWKFTI